MKNAYMTSQEEIQQLMHNVSHAGKVALTHVVHLHLQAITARMPVPATSVISKQVTEELQAIRDDDLYYLVDKLGVGNFPPSIKVFFQRELERRQGNNLTWVYMGMIDIMTPDILIIRYILTPTETPSPEMQGN